MSTQRFRPYERLKTPADFDRVYAGRRSASDGTLIVYGIPNQLLHSRIGLSVSRRVGNAPRRSQWRRLLREAFRLTRPQIPTGFDLVFVPRPTAEPTLAGLCASLPTLVGQLARKWQRDGNEPVEKK